MRQRVAQILAAVALSGIPSLVAAGTLTQCEVGQAVIYDGGNLGQVVGGSDGLCVIKSPDGRFQSLVSVDRLRPAPPAEPDGSAVGQASLPAPKGDVPVPSLGVKILRPTVINRLVYRADALGHVVLTANVNGAPVQFLVDTGATLVSLTPEDAKAAGLDHAELKFDQNVQTANGPARAAFVRLREMRIDQLEVDNVQAAVIDSLKRSILGMSFLRRLAGFEERDGALTISW
jgi:aspartyl protease family protein